LIADLVITNAKAYVKNEIIDCSIAVENGEILKVGKETQMPNADERINLKKLLVLPGLIDVHVHLRDEGKAYKEDFYTGTAAAAAGGFTTVLDMPNNDPVTMTAESMRNRMSLAERRVLVNVGFYSEFPRHLKEIRDIVSEGALAFKLFMANRVGGLIINDDQELHEAFTEVGVVKVPVAVHAEDHSLVSVKEQELKTAKYDDATAFLKAHPEQAELKAIEQVLKTSSGTEAHVHFCHVTTEEGLNRIGEAKKKGRTVTCEVTPNHLLLSKVDFVRVGAMLSMMPPLREGADVKALWQGVEKGLVDVLGSDHAPHTMEEKSAKSIWDAKVGVPGLETTLPLMLTMVKKNRLTIDMLVRLLAEKPAEIFKLKGRGRLEQGMKADVVAVDLKEKFKVDASKFHSKAKYSPYAGWEVQGKPIKTFVNGHLVMDEQEIVAKAGSGSVIRRGI
jgi:dihydroorotase